jgi:hypothetical protein
MKMVETIVSDELVVYTVKSELASRYSLRNATNDCTEIWMPSQVARKVIKSEYNIFEPAFPVSHMQPSQNRAVCHHLRNHSLRVA